jgi:type IV secretion system protein VirB10
MSSQRAVRQEQPITAPATRAPQIAQAAPTPEPLPLPETPTAAPAQVYRVPTPPLPPPPALPAPLPPASAAPPTAPAIDPAARRKAPAVIVDLSPASPAPAGPAAAAAKPAGPAVAAAAPADKADSDLSAEDRFAERIGGGGGPETVHATQLKNLSMLIPQGAVIPGVLETALDSDLPGFARAVVSRDVMGFDGTEVLIPRGSRLIGQYKSGLAQGASRIFVIWSRVIRPDGVSVQIGSPGTDPLGRGGLDGQVDRHFFQRFGSSILLSVITAGVPALLNRNATTSNQIIIGSSADATSVATDALKKDQDIGPTVRTPQGAPIRIFIAKDLDFSGMGPVRTPIAAGPRPLRR